ncbi:MAG: FHA domain-containing protein [Acidimicrobiales bacterium]
MTTAGQACDNCGVAHGPDDIFCENCGYDFITGSMPSADELAIAAPAVAPTAGPTVGEAPVAENPGGNPSVGTAPASGRIPGRLAFDITVDRAYFEQVVSAGELEYPDPEPAPHHLEVVGDELHIGRTSRSRAIHPDLDISDLTGDPAVSSRHAVVRVGPDGTLTVTDVGSTNGTVVGDPASEPITVGESVLVAEGTAFYVGAWTRLTMTRILVT